MKVILEAESTGRRDEAQDIENENTEIENVENANAENENAENEIVNETSRTSVWPVTQVSQSVSRQSVRPVKSR